jgi:hypothetical protein
MSRVVTYRNNERQCFCQIRFESGERVLISIAGTPIPSLRVIRLVLGGLVPRQTIWEYSAVIAGGRDAYVSGVMQMFPPDPNGAVHPLDILRDALLVCSSIEDVRRTLQARQNAIRAEPSLG